MKKLIVLIVIAIALLFSGCGLTTPDCPEIPECPDCICAACPDCICPAGSSCSCPSSPDCICPAGSCPDCECECECGCPEGGPPIIINGILSPGEWDCATVINFAGGKGVVKVLVTVDYLYVAFDIADPTDDRLDENLCGNDKLSINVNPTFGVAYGKPCDIVFQTGTDPVAFSTPDPNPDNSSSGLIDGYETEWCIDGVQLVLPVGLETMTLYDTVSRVTEWKLPLASIALAYGDQIKVGGNADLDDGGSCSSYRAPATLDWHDVSTYVDIVVY